jgi:hypothetical protein
MVLPTDVSETQKIKGFRLPFPTLCVAAKLTSQIGRDGVIPFREYFAGLQSK